MVETSGMWGRAGIVHQDRMAFASMKKGTRVGIDIVGAAVHLPGCTQEGVADGGPSRPRVVPEGLSPLFNEIIPAQTLLSICLGEIQKLLLAWGLVRREARLPAGACSHLEQNHSTAFPASPCIPQLLEEKAHYNVILLHAPSPGTWGPGFR
jgi:hypothetical protein